MIFLGLRVVRYENIEIMKYEDAVFLYCFRLYYDIGIYRRISKIEIVFLVLVLTFRIRQ